VVAGKRKLWKLQRNRDQANEANSGATFRYLTPTSASNYAMQQTGNPFFFGSNQFYNNRGQSLSAQVTLWASQTT